MADIQGTIAVKSQIIGQLSGQMAIGGLIFNDVELIDGHIIFTLVDNTTVDGGKVVFEYSDFTPEQLALLKGEKVDQGIQGLPGLDGADAVAGKLPSSYVELETPQGVTSASLIDVPGMSTTIFLYLS